MSLIINPTTKVKDNTRKIKPAYIPRQSFIKYVSNFKNHKKQNKTLNLTNHVFMLKSTKYRIQYK